MNILVKNRVKAFLKIVRVLNEFSPTAPALFALVLIFAIIVVSKMN